MNLIVQDNLIEFQLMIDKMDLCQLFPGHNFQEFQFLLSSVFPGEMNVSHNEKISKELNEHPEIPRMQGSFLKSIWLKFTKNLN